MELLLQTMMKTEHFQARKASAEAQGIEVATYEPDLYIPSDGEESDEDTEAAALFGRMASIITEVADSAEGRGEQQPPAATSPPMVLSFSYAEGYKADIRTVGNMEVTMRALQATETGPPEVLPAEAMGRHRFKCKPELPEGLEMDRLTGRITGAADPDAVGTHHIKV